MKLLRYNLEPVEIEPQALLRVVAEDNFLIRVFYTTDGVNSVNCVGYALINN